MVGLGLSLGKLELLVEATKSKTGLHAARSIIIIISHDKKIKIIDRPESPAKGTYSRGTAGLTSINLEPGEVAVYARLILNPEGHVSGRFIVYSHENKPILEARLRKRKVRRISGDPSYSWAIELALKKLHLDKHVRRFNWDTGALRQ